MASSSSSSSHSRSSIYPPGGGRGRGRGGPVGSSRSLGSMSMEEFFRNIVAENSAAMGSVDVPPSSADAPPPAIGQDGRFFPPRASAVKTAEEVWREITAGGRANPVCVDGPSPAPAEMSLEEYLTRSGVVTEDEVRTVPESGQAVFLARQAMAGHQFSSQAMVGHHFSSQAMAGHQFSSQAMAGHRFGNVAESGGIGGGRGGRRMKRAQVEPLDNAALQRQKRMIKNRESAARSRERKQAYTAELESMVSQLEAKNEQMLMELEERQKERLKELRENIIPVTEGKRKRPPLRRTRSLEW